MSKERDRERGLDDELRFHLEMETRELRRQGLNELEAARRARLGLGGVEQVKEACRDEWRGHWLDALVRDARYALRTLAQTPGFSAVAVLTLALGIGANTAIFSLINGVLLQPLPYRDGRELVILRQQAPLAGLDNVAFSVREVYDYRELNQSLSDLVEHHSMSFTLLGRGEPERVSTGVVSADFFTALGVQPVLGRTFLPEDDDLGAEAVLVLSHGYWQRSFGGDPGVVGQVFEMNDRPHTVVGVLPQIPQFPVEHDVYMPTSACPFRANGERNMVQNRGAFRAMTVFGRLADGVSLDSAGVDFAAIAARFEHDYPETYSPERGYAVDVVPLQEELTRQARPTLLILLGTAGLVLLIACANVANLAVARLIRRQRELAIRTALGASRTRLAQQTLVESTLLAVAGGALGLLLAYGALDLLVTFTARFTPRAADVEIDGWVLLFALLVSLLTGLALGALPAASRQRHLAGTLREGGRTTASRGQQRFRSALIGAQVAVAVVLLVGAGLMLRSLYRLAQVDPGFTTDNVLVARLTRNWSTYQTIEQIQPFFDGLLERARAMPGVVAAGAGSIRPLDGQPPFINDVLLESRPRESGQLAPQAALRIATTDYFRTIGVPLIAGRDFGIEDDRDAPPVAVISDSLRRQHFADSDALGERLSLDGGDTWLTVVGVVGDIHERALEASPVAAIYLPQAQSFWPTHLVVRTHGDPRLLARAIKQAVHAIDPQQPIDDFATLAETRRAAIASPRLTATLLSLFAGLALVITATGLGGVVAFAVSQRRHELGIRMALGAPRRRVMMMVAGQGLLLVGGGLATGLVGALLLGRFLAGLLFETGPGDPLTLLAVATVLLLVTGAACLLPAQRATRLDPTTTLRSN